MPSQTALLVQMARLSLKGQTVLITGASGGIGSALAKVFHKAGTNLILTGTSADKLKAVVDSLRQAEAREGGQVRVWSYVCDLRKREEVRDLVEKTVKECTPVDILINNAGWALGATKPFWEQDPDDLESVLRLNVEGLMHLTQGVLREGMMKREGQPRGTILNMSSVTAQTAPSAEFCEGSYHTSKAALEGFSNVLRNELVGTNIRVLVHRPGVTKTEFHTRRVGYDERKAASFVEGTEPLNPNDIAVNVLYQVAAPERVSITEMNTVASSMRSLLVVDTEWENRNPVPVAKEKKQPPPQLTDAELPEHPALEKGNVAVITGASLGGIGYATALKLLQRYGLRVVLVDVDPVALDNTAAELATAGVPKSQFECVVCDVSKWEDVKALADATFTKYGQVDVLFANAGVGSGSKDFAEGGDMAAWHKLLSVNLFGVLHCTQAFVDRMVKQDRPGLVVVTGSKQGVTQPPGNPAYNTSKSAVKSITESLAHSLIPTKLTAHLLVPGWTWTKISGGWSSEKEKPAEAWRPEQVATELLSRLGEFYIFCEDGAVTWEMDRARMAWNAGDMLERRPALSRWHPAWKARFEAYLEDELALEE